ncbi:MAG: VOC family protein [Phycisphaerae bacterium]|nr:VOC family protein [Phycisphaerae bacterium]
MAIRGVIETCLYVADVARAATFYRDVLGFRLLSVDDRMASLSVAERQLLLLFRTGGTTRPIATTGGVIPPHDGSGRLHVGFSIDHADVQTWRDRLAAANVAIESEVTWPRGGVSLYFRDPDENLVELLTPGVWEIY